MPRSKQKSLNLFPNKLLDALRFISRCQSFKGTEQQRFCMLGSNKAIAFTGVIAMGQEIDIDIEAYPNTMLLLAALERCDREYGLVQPSLDVLDVRSGEFRASIPCCPGERLTAANPDAAQGEINDDLAAALKIVTPLADDKSEFILSASIQFYNGSVTATDNVIVLEAWHGNQCPTFVIPKDAAKIILKCKKTIQHLGISNTTATFWFDDNSWLQTMIYTDKVQDIREFLNVESNPREIDPSTFDAARRVAPFSQDSRLYFREGKVSSHHDTVTGPVQFTASSEFNIIEDKTKIDNRIYQAEAFINLQRWATKIDEHALDHATLFWGDNVRGAIAHTIYEKDIPF